MKLRYLFPFFLLAITGATATAKSYSPPLDIPLQRAVRNSTIQVTKNVEIPYEGSHRIAFFLLDGDHKNVLAYGSRPNKLFSYLNSMSSTNRFCTIHPIGGTADSLILKSGEKFKSDWQYLSTDRTSDSIIGELTTGLFVNPEQDDEAIFFFAKTLNGGMLNDGLTEPTLRGALVSGFFVAANAIINSYRQNEGYQKNVRGDFVLYRTILSITNGKPNGDFDLSCFAYSKKTDSYEDGNRPFTYRDFLQVLGKYIVLNR